MKDINEIIVEDVSDGLNIMLSHDPIEESEIWLQFANSFIRRGCSPATVGANADIVLEQYLERFDSGVE